MVPMEEGLSDPVLGLGSVLQPETIRFNFDLDVLYLDMGREEDGLRHLFGILKETS